MDILRALKFKSSYAFLKRLPGTFLTIVAVKQPLSVVLGVREWYLINRY